MLALSSNTAWKENDPKRSGVWRSVTVTSSASGLGEAETDGKALVLGLVQW